MSLDVLVAACEHLETLPADLERVALEEGAARFSLVQGLCRSQPALPSAPADAAVAVVCRWPDDPDALRRAFREVEVSDPLVRIVVVSEAAPAPARAAVRGAVRRWRRSALPRHTRPRWGTSPARRSRRALLGLPPLAFDPLPTVDPELCEAAEGCRSCVEACPRDALVVAGERVLLDAAQCTSCGVCAAVCPTRATELGGYGPGDVEEELRAGLAEAPGAAVAFACPRRHVREDWVQVLVPCASAVTAGMVAGALALGASAVALAQCGDGCRSGSDELPRARAEEIASSLAGWEREPRLVSFVRAGALPPDPPSGAPPARELPPGFATVSGLAWRALLPPEGDAVDSPHLGVGFASIDAGACTSCGTCARVCPTGAIELFQEGERTSLTYEHARCVACGLCVHNCPERAAGAITVTARLSPRELPSRRLVRESGVRRCRRCGGEVASEAVLARMREVLGASFDEERMANLCPSCRGLG